MSAPIEVGACYRAPAIGSVVRVLGPADGPGWRVRWLGSGRDGVVIDLSGWHRVPDPTPAVIDDELDEVRGQLAALHAAGRAYVSEQVESVQRQRLWAPLCAALDDTAAAAKAYTDAVREPVERERDAAIARAEAAKRDLHALRAGVIDGRATMERLAHECGVMVAALAEVRDRMRVVTSRNVPMQAIVDACEAAVAMLPADLAAQRDARVRAEVISEVLGLYDGTNGCAAADLTPVIEAAQALDRRVRAEELRNAAKVAHDYGAEGHDERTWANDAAAEIEDRLRAAADKVESGGASTQAAPDLRAIYAKMRQHLNSALGEYHDTADLNAALALLDEAEKGGT